MNAVPPANSPLWTIVPRVATGAALMPYVHLAYRVRGWGRLPSKRGPTLVIANHQHDLDPLAIMARLILDGPWRRPIRTISSRRMFETGFFAVRTPWLAALTRSYDPTALFAVLGPMPIENDVRRRILRSIARTLRRNHESLTLSEVLEPETLAALGVPPEVRLDDLWSPRWFDAAGTMIEWRALREPYRTEMREDTRHSVAEDLARIEATLRAGDTFFLTPEGQSTTSGALLRFREAFARLAPLADLWVAPISYDVLHGRRLSQLYRIVRPERPSDIRASLAAARPVTVSQLLSAWLLERDDSAFRAGAAQGAVEAALASLPGRLFIDPELQGKSASVVDEALERCTALGILTRSKAGYRLNAVRHHPKFPEVADMLAFQKRFFDETLAASRVLDQPVA